MNTKNTGGPAFPSYEMAYPKDAEPHLVVAHGMTLRDYFAAKAMQAYITSSHTALGKQYAHNIGAINPIIAMAAYETADAMLKARGE